MAAGAEAPLVVVRQTLFLGHSCDNPDIIASEVWLAQKLPRAVFGPPLPPLKNLVIPAYSPYQSIAIEE